MRHFFTVAAILLPALFLSACESKSIESSYPLLTFKSDIEIVSENLNLSAKIVRAQDKTQLSITSPGSLNGLSVRQDKTGSSISKNGLEYKTDNLILPSCSSILAIFEVLNFMAGSDKEDPLYNDSEEMSFIGKVNYGKFELKIDRETLLVKEITFADMVNVKFKNQEKL